MAELSTNRLINVSITLGAKAASQRGFGTLLFIGESDVLGISEPIRAYNDSNSVINDFGTDSMEAKAAIKYFSQDPAPREMMIGRWFKESAPAALTGAILTETEQTLSNWTAIEDGSFVVTADGVASAVNGLDFSAQTNLNGVAEVINASLPEGVTISWNGSQFILKCNEKLSYLTTAAEGTDISAQLKMTAETALSVTDPITAESILDCVSRMIDNTSGWYALVIVPDNAITNAQLLEVAELIESQSDVTRIMGITETDTRCLSSAYTQDLAALTKAKNLKRTTVQYSSTDNLAVVSMLARGLTVNFNGSNTTLTLMFKQEPTIVAESLTATQANTLQAKNANVFVKYNNDTAILQFGTMANGYYFDEVHGSDWLQEYIRTNVWNLLYTTTTKIGQTDQGVNKIINTVNASLDQAVQNGFVAAGQWNQEGFGQLERGQFLTDGYYVYAPPVSTQAQSDREDRKSVPIQFAAKLQGAIHTVDIIGTLNR